jgi:hypothetical protein
MRVPLSMRRLLAGQGVTPHCAPNGEDGEAQADGRRRDGAGDDDATGVAQLAAGRVTDGGYQLGDRVGRREARGESSLEAAADRQRAKRRAEHRGGVDQRRQLRPGGGLASGQKAVDCLIQAFGRRAR